jgi:hypothetical protein
MEDYDDGSGQAHQQDLLRQQEIEEALGLFSPVYVLSSQQLTLEILFQKHGGLANGLNRSLRGGVIPNSTQERQLANSLHHSRHQA